MTNSSVFGSGASVAGFFLNDSGFFFTPDNLGAPSLSHWRTRATTISPTVVLQDGRVEMVVGAPGGGLIPTSIVQTMVYVLDYDMDPLEAVRMPRLFSTPTGPTIQLETGFTAEALERAHRSLATAREIFGSDHPTLGKSLGIVGLVLHRSGESAAAEPYLRQSLEIFRETQPEGHFRTARAEVLLGSCLTALGRLREAEPLLTHGVESLAARYDADHPYLREAREELAVHRRASRKSDLLSD